jgi:hypothetical protein
MSFSPGPKFTLFLTFFVYPPNHLPPHPLPPKNQAAKEVKEWSIQALAMHLGVDGVQVQSSLETANYISFQGALTCPYSRGYIPLHSGSGTEGEDMKSGSGIGCGCGIGCGIGCGVVVLVVVLVEVLVEVLEVLVEVQGYWYCTD